MQLIGKHHVGALEIKMENGLRRQGMQEIHAERDLSCQRIKGHMLESNFKIINMLESLFKNKYETNVMYSNYMSSAEGIEQKEDTDVNVYLYGLQY